MPKIDDVKQILSYGTLDDVEKLAKEIDLKNYRLDNVGSQPIHIAIKNSNPDVLKYLLKNIQIDANQPTDNGALPIHIAAGQGKLEALRLLMEYGADGYKKSPNNLSVKDILIYSGHEELVSEAEKILKNPYDNKKSYEQDNKPNVSNNIFSILQGFWQKPTISSNSNPYQLLNKNSPKNIKTK